MVTTIVTTKGQIVIPSKMRARLHITRGTKLCIMEKNGELVLQPLNKEYFEHLAGVLGGQKKLAHKLLEERARDAKKEDAKCRRS